MCVFLCMYVWMSLAYWRNALAFGEFRWLSTRLARWYSLFRPSRPNKRCKGNVRRNVYDGDRTYVNSKLTVRSWSVLRRLKTVPSAMENDALDPAVTKDAVVQGRWTIDPSPSRRNSTKSSNVTKSSLLTSYSIDFGNAERKRIY